jgi:hypothetical protein
MKAKTIKEYLIATRYIIDNYGWCQNSYFKFKNGAPFWEEMKIDSQTFGGSCLEGAINLVEAVDGLRIATINTIEQVLPDHMSLRTLPYFNDAPGRTKEEVLAFLDTLIEKA